MGKLTIYSNIWATFGWLQWVWVICCGNGSSPFLKTVLVVPNNIGGLQLACSGSELNLMILGTDTFVNCERWYLHTCLHRDGEGWVKWDSSQSPENQCLLHLAQQQDKYYSNLFLSYFLCRHGFCENLITSHKKLQQNAIKKLTWRKKIWGWINTTIVSIIW